MPEQIEGHDITKVLGVAQKAVRDKTVHSVVMDTEAEDRIPKFEKKELEIGKVLGRGGFCVVNEITSITLASSSPENGVPDIAVNNNTDEHLIHNIVQDRDFMAAHCVRQGKDYRYAIKHIQDSAKKSVQLFINAVVDLAIEARFLSVVRHPNIIKMRAMATGSPFDGKFFVVLDKLYDILSTRLRTWKKKLPGKLARFTMGGAAGRVGKEQWGERLTCCYDLTSALKYLHGLNIMYRDLKPDNIGFDVRGDVKIFDFGLAKEYSPDKRADDGTFRLTGDTGSPRYMAPEVFLEQPYNETCDVYSFCILMWQILKLETPFEGYTSNLMIKSVYKGGARPKPDPNWPPEVQECLRNGWDAKLQNRRTMEQLSEVLREIVEKETDEELQDAIDVSRKSELSLRAIKS